MSMTLLLRPTDYRQLQWKNGQGTTAEIAIEPAGCDFSKDPFDWRLSSARVEQGGPFSQFPGYDRFLTIVSGGAILLHMDTDEKTLAEGEVIHFSGEVSVSCKLPSGAITDLNLIYRRDRIKAGFGVITIGPQSFALTAAAETTFIFMISQALKASNSKTGESVTVQTGETLRLKRGDSLQLTAATNVQFALIEIDPLT